MHLKLQYPLVSKPLNLLLLMGYVLSGFLVSAQVNTDSLVMQAYASLQEGEHVRALQQAYLGKAAAPEYLDFHLVIGRAHQLRKQKDSARYYFKHVIAENPAYEDAFTYLIQLELETENYGNAEEVIDNAMQVHPENPLFPLKKWQLYQLQEDVDKERAWLAELAVRFPENSALRQRMFWLDSRYDSDRIGLRYSLKHFDRDGLGPWHLGSLQYIGERKWGTLIGRVNYANRQAEGVTIIDGVQAEAETYFFTGEKSYAHLSAAYSEDLVFPKWRLGATYFQALPKGWEADFGLRYTYVGGDDLPAISLGLGKYFNSYWIHLRSFFQEQKSDIFPALTLTGRYYIDTRFDYITVIAGYGTSVDERAVLAELSQQLRLDSYRLGAGYFRQLGQHFLVGIQGVYARQEYIQDNWQNEYEAFLMLQYRL